MSKSVEELNQMTEAQASVTLSQACGAQNWVRAVVEARPFDSVDSLVRCAHAVWSRASRADILEAFGHHPRIGADIEKLREKFAATAGLSEGEQSGVAGASEKTLAALRDGNLRYEERYGHIFIVCATGKTAEQMLALLEARMDNEPQEELRVAAAEQGKITELRLRGMFAQSNASV